MAEQPKNLRNVDSKHIKKRRASDNLPAVNRTKLNTEFLSATLDHLIQPQLSTEMEGYIGNKPSYYNSTRDFYIPEPTNSREFYQLTTALVQRNHETKAIEHTMFYDDLINYLRFNGGLVENHERLFSQNYYSWQPPIDLDKFINFRNYYWIAGPIPYSIGQVTETFIGDAIVDTYTLPISLDNVSDLSVTVDFIEIPLFDATQQQTTWFKIENNNVRIFPVPSFGSKIELTLTSQLVSDIDTLIGSETGTLVLYGNSLITLSSGMRIKITNDINTAHNDKIYIVEGVGRSIYFVEDMINSSNWDMQPWDSTAWDEYTDLSKPDYTTIERGGENRWSKINRWFHRDVIQNFYDKTIVKIQAERPIIEFEHKIELYNFGFNQKQRIDFIIDSVGLLETICKIKELNFNYIVNGYVYGSSAHTPNQMVWKHPLFDLEIHDTSSEFSTLWELKSYGFSPVYLNGYPVYSGMRVIDKNKIYTIQDIENGNIVPILDSVIDPVRGDMTTEMFSDTDYWFNGTNWIKSQQKDGVPLFNLYDNNEIPLNDSLEYPKSNFAGNKIFSYKLGNGVNDGVLGIPLAYDNYGEIIFENTIISDEYHYFLNSNKTTIPGFKYFKNGQEFTNNWYTVPYKSPQKFTQRFDNKNDNTLFRLKMTLRNLPYSGDYLVIKVDNTVLNSDQYSLQGNILRILPEIILGSKIIEVEMIGDLVDINNQDYYVDEFTYSDSNVFQLQEKPIAPLTDDTIRVFVNGAPILTSQLVLIEDSYLEINHAFAPGDNVLVAVYIAKQQPTEFAFWNVPINLEANALNKNFKELSRGDYFKHFSTSIARQENFIGNPLALNNYRDTQKIKFLGENILQHSAPMAKLMYLASDKKVDMLKAIQYVEREYVRFKNKFIQQISNIRTTGELNPSDPVTLWVNTALSKINLGKTQDFPFYNTGALDVLTWVPPTPAFLGIFAAQKPELFVEEINFESTTYIKGHDGSLVLGFNDIRDDVLLEFETQIYNSVKTTQHYDIFDIIPGKLRVTDYSIDEIKTTMQPMIERWAATNAVDYKKNTTYDVNNPFTYNYTGSLDLTGNKVFGSWRSVYKWFFDTDRVNTHPWEALHFAEKPVWWEEEYGVSPYTSGNTKLWEDIGQGVIRQGANAGTHTHLKRETNTYTIWDILPVGTVGELLDPIAAGIIPTIPNSAQAGANWTVMDNGPVESVWTNSENYPFVLSQLAFLLKPAEFVENTWDTSNGKTVYGQKILSNSGTRYDNNSLVHDENGLQVFGSQQFVVALLEQNNVASSYLGNAIRNLDVQLGHKMAGFVDNSLTLMNDAFSLIPAENSEVILYEGQSIKEEFYSGVVVEWTGNSYKIYGYNLIDPVFPTIPHSPNGRKTKIVIGSRNANFEDWAPQKYYLLGDVVIRNNAFYKATENHKATSTFDPTSWVAIERPATTALMELVKYLDPLQDKPIVNVSYGQEFSTVQDVFTFLHNYERYLVNRGWIFDGFDEVINSAKDWTLAGKQFATWSLNQWPVGSFITLSPVSDGIKFKSPQGQIKPIEQITNGVYSILNRNGDRILTTDTVVSRFEDTVTVSPTDVDNILTGIYAIRLYVTEFEHALIVSNRTLFGDTLYDPIFNSRVNRLRVSMVRSDNWNGRLDAPGYLVSNNTLISNYEKTVNDFRKYFDIEDQVNDKSLRMYGTHNIAYQDRSFLNRLIISEKSQLNFYQGMIQQKGTSAALNKLLRSDFVTRYSDISLYEEWAFREGAFGSYDAMPSIELKIPNSDYDRDPQLIEFKEVTFDDVSFSDLTQWRYDYQSRTGTLPSALNSEWSKPVWDDWFNTFYFDNKNDSTITTYVVKDINGNVIAGDERWVSLPTDANIFPILNRPLNSLPTAGYVHVNEYDHVYTSYMDMVAAGTFSNGSELYKNGDVIWMYNNYALEARVFALDENGNNVVGQSGTDVYSGMTSFKTSWSVYRMLEQPWIVKSIKSISQTNTYEIETTLPHGLKNGEVLVVYDSTARTVLDNPGPVVINNVESQYRFRIPKDIIPFAVNSVDDTDFKFLKMVETRFDTLGKTSNDSYSVSNYISNNNFNTDTDDLLWVDEGIDLTTNNKFGGWATYKFSWFSEEDYSRDIVYAKVPMNFSQINWQTKIGFDAASLSNQKFVLGHAIVDKFVNNQYLIKNTGISSDTNDYALSYFDNRLNISLTNKWYNFVDYVSQCSEIALYASYNSFKSIRKEDLKDFNGRFFTGYVAVAAGFTNIDKHFRIAPKQKVAPLNSDFWIFVDPDNNPNDDAVLQYSNGVWTVISVNIGDNFWDPNTKTMLTVSNTAPLSVAPITIEENDAWFDVDTGIPYLIESNIPNKIVSSEYYWYDTEPTSPSGIWKKLINNVWTETPIAVGSHVYDIIAKKLYVRTATPAMWSDTVVTEQDIVFAVNINQTFKGINLTKIAQLEYNEFIFDGNTMFRWDGSSISTVPFQNGERWIANYEPAYIDTSRPNKFVRISLNSNEYWANISLGLIFQYSIQSSKFSRITLNNGDIWNNGTQSYIFNNNAFTSHNFVEGEFVYDFTNDKMFIFTNGTLLNYNFNSGNYYWLNDNVMYSSKNMKSLISVVFKNGDYILNNNQLAQFNGIEFVATVLANGNYYSTIENKIFNVAQNNIAVAIPGLYFSTRLFNFTTIATVVTPTTIDFKVTDFKQVVGKTPNDESIVVSEITYPTITPLSLDSYSWSHLGPILVEHRRELKKIDSTTLARTLIYDSSNNTVDAELFIYDPVKGLIPGVADKEIWFKTDIDPAVYNEDIRSQTVKAAWGSKHIGQTWWNLSTAKYLEYEMDDLEYRRNYWGSLAPHSTIDVYEWVESLIKPEEYNAQARANRIQNVNDSLPTGTPLMVNGDYMFNTEQIIDESDNIKTVYYFWVRNKQTLPSRNKTQYNRKLTGAQLAGIISNPTSNGIIWAAPIAENAMIFANVANFLTGNSSVLQINLALNQNDGLMQKQFTLGRESDPNWLPTATLWQRMSNSLTAAQYFWQNAVVLSNINGILTLSETNGLQSYGILTINGLDVEYSFNGATVNIGNTQISIGDTLSYQVYFDIPDDKLPESQKYGNLIRPRQSWFKQFKEARNVFVENINSQLRNVWLTKDRFDWDTNLYASDPEPTHYTLRVNDLQERDLAQSLGQVVPGDRVLVGGNIETNYYWTMWELSDANTWLIYKAQMYRVQDFWNFADYYDVSLDIDQEPLRIFRNIADLDFNTPNIDFTENELIKILDVGDGTWEWRKFVNNNFIIVAKENATIAFKSFDSNTRIILDDHFYKISSVNADYEYKPFWDMYPWDTAAWDNAGFEFKNDVINLNDIENLVEYIDNRDGTIELNVILNEIRNNRILNVLEQNNLFFSLINYVHVEHSVVDWAFKTSYISISGYTEQLEQVEIQQPDMTNALFDYIEESKPYHTKIRNFLRQVNASDEVTVNVDDYARTLRIVQKFDRVSCDETQFLPNANWDMNSWDSLSWDYNMTAEDLANEPFIFRATADGQTFKWDMVSSRTTLFYNVKTKQTNKTENLLYYVVNGYVPDNKWLNNIERVAIKDASGFEQVLTNSQWSVVKENGNIVLQISTVPIKGQIVEVTRFISEYDRILRMYKSFDTTKLGNPVVNVVPKIPVIKNCDFNGTIVDGGQFSSGWDTQPWDSNSINVLMRPNGFAINKFIGDASTNNTLAEFWIDENELPINQLQYFDGSDWVPLSLIYGDWFLNVDDGIYYIWTGSIWESLITENGWDSEFDNNYEAEINSGDMSEWQVFVFDGDNTITLEQRTEYGSIGFVVVYVNNTFVAPTDYTFDIANGTVDVTALTLSIGDVIAVYKVFDFNDAGITATFGKGPNDDNWNTLIDGGDFIQPWIGPNRPEELAYLKVNDTLMIDVMNKASSGMPFITNNSFVGDGSSGPFNLIVPIQSNESVFVYANGILVDETEYTIDTNTMTIMFTTTTVVGLQYLVKSFSDNNVSLWGEYSFTGPIEQIVLNDIPVVNKMMVLVDGNIVWFNTDGPEFTAEELANGVPFAIDNFILTIDEGSNVQVKVWVNQLGTRLFGFDNVSDVNTLNLKAGIDGIILNESVNDLGPNDDIAGVATRFEIAGLFSIENYDLEIDDSELSLDDDTLMLNINRAYNSDELLVHVNGLRIPGPATLYARGNGIDSSFVFKKQLPGDTFAVTVDGMVMDISVVSTIDEVTVNFDFVPDDSAIIRVQQYDGAEFEIHNGQLYITKLLDANDDITVVKFTTPDEFNINTNTFVGSTTGRYIISQKPLDGNHTWVTINGERKIFNVHYTLSTTYKGWDSMPWDYDATISEMLPNSTNNSEATIKQYGFSEQGWDRVFVETEIIMTVPQNDTDIVIITSFDGIPAKPAVAFRMFKTKNDNWEFIRISDAHKTILKSDVLSDSNEIEVWENELPEYMRVDSPLMMPNRDQNIPGVIWINGERIKYWSINEQPLESGRRWWKLGDLERGTLNTLHNVDHVDVQLINADGSTGTFPITLGDDIVVTVNGKRAIEFNATIASEVQAGTYENNSGVWTWDYKLENSNSNITFRQGQNPVGEIKIYTRTINTIEHYANDVVIDGNINQRIPGGYYWKWANTVNKGLQLNGDEMSTFLLNRPGSII